MTTNETRAAIGGILRTSQREGNALKSDFCRSRSRTSFGTQSAELVRAAPTLLRLDVETSDDLRWPTDRSRYLVPRHS